MGIAYLGQGRNNTDPYKTLDYIKNHLRYRMGFKMGLPLVFWTLLLLAGAVFFSFKLFGTVRERAGNFILVLPVVVLLPLIIGIIRYLNSLKFIPLNTGLDKATNLRLVTLFLQRQQLQIGYHPQTEDILQIISTPVSVKHDQMREVMVFIADEGRILINSHFMGGGLTLIPGTRHHRQMAAQLQQWISANREKNGPGSAVVAR